MPVLAAFAAALLAVVHAVLIVCRLPEPTDHPPDDPPKTPYRDLVTARNVLGVFVGCLVLGQILWVVPVTQWPAWVAYIGAGGVLVAVDLATTYLPRRLHYIVLAEVVIGVAWWGSQVGWAQLGRPVVAAGVAYAIFWLVWRFAGGIGFGDVRLMVVVGLVAALSGWNAFTTALLAGTIIGALWGIAHQLTRRRSGRPAFFPYGPALWLGPFVAALLSAWTG